MKQYRIIYWNNGNKRTVTINADNYSEAKRIFFMTVAHDDIIRIEEVTDDV